MDWRRTDCNQRLTSQKTFWIITIPSILKVLLLVWVASLLVCPLLVSCCGFCIVDIENFGKNPQSKAQSLPADMEHDYAMHTRHMGWHMFAAGSLGEPVPELWSCGTNQQTMNQGTVGRTPLFTTTDPCVPPSSHRTLESHESRWKWVFQITVMLCCFNHRNYLYFAISVRRNILRVCSPN